MLQTLTKISVIIVGIVMVTACATPVRDSNERTVAGSSEASRPALYNKAIAAAKEGKTDKAIELLNKVIRDNPDYTVAYTDLGLQYLHKEDMENAEKSFEKSISLNSSNFVAYNHRGVVMRKRGDFAGAKNMYEAAIKYNPDYANAHLNIAVLYDIYLYELEPAMHHYNKYQSLTKGKDKLVGKWIVDLQRRITANTKQSKNDR